MAKKRKPRVPADIPKEETKAARFIRVVTPRIQKAVKRIQQIGQCAGAGYEYTPEQASQIIVALQVAMNSLEAKFESKSDAQSAFGFKS